MSTPPNLGCPGCGSTQFDERGRAEYDRWVQVHRSMSGNLTVTDIGKPGYRDHEQYGVVCQGCGAMFSLDGPDFRPEEMMPPDDWW